MEVINKQAEIYSEAYVSLRERDPIVCTMMGYSEAVAHIKRTRGKTLFLHAETSIRNMTTLDVKYGTIAGTVILTKPAMLRFLESCFPKAHAEWMIGIGECSNCLFVGSYY